MGAGASSIDNRKKVVGYQLDAQDKMCTMIRQNGGGNCPGNYYQTWTKANGMGLLTPNTSTEYRQLGIQANHAKHRW